MRIASFDIGKKNFAFYVEEFIQEKLPFIEKKYNIDGTPTTKFQNIIDLICQNGKCITFQNHDLTIETKTNSDIFYNMIRVLNSNKEIWEKCDIILIEQQMSFGKKYNTMALKLGQHCWSYFAFQYGRSKQIIEFPAYHKTQVLGSQKHKTKNGKFKCISKPERKKWTIEFSKHILFHRADDETLSILYENKKKDDLADTFCQLQAYKILTLT